MWIFILKYAIGFFILQEMERTQKRMAIQHVVLKAQKELHALVKWHNIRTMKCTNLYHFRMTYTLLIISFRKIFRKIM